MVNCGAERNVIRFIPPLITSGAELDRAMTILEKGVAALR
jgi:4-aminobutyrate aminotransferase-like enzyme